jgi:hypothetical protein
VAPTTSSPWRAYFVTSRALGALPATALLALRVPEGPDWVLAAIGRLMLRLHVVVCDDGRGVSAFVGSGATGMRSLRNRAEALGVLRVAREANGRGTLAALDVPGSRAVARTP